MYFLTDEEQKNLIGEISRNEKITFHCVFFHNDFKGVWDLRNPGDFFISGGWCVQDNRLLVGSHILDVKQMVVVRFEDFSIYESYILIHAKSERTCTTYLVDDKHIISEEEYRNQYAEIDGIVECLSSHRVNVLHEDARDQIWIISPEGTPATYGDLSCSSFLAKIFVDEKNPSDKLFQFMSGGHWKMDDEIAMRL